jgi:hypothetical protein
VLELLQQDSIDDDHDDWDISSLGNMLSQLLGVKVILHTHERLATSLAGDNSQHDRSFRVRPDTLCAGTPPKRRLPVLEGRPVDVELLQDALERRAGQAATLRG